MSDFSEVVKVDHSQLKTVVEQNFEKRLPTMVYGQPGIGKSVAIEDFAREKAEEEGKEFVDWGNLTKDEQEDILTNRVDEVFAYYDIRLINNDPSDLKGMPSTDTLGEEEMAQIEFTDWVPDLWSRSICHPDITGVIFFDEGNLAPPLVQSSMYQIIHDGKIANRKISDDIWAVSAGNRPGIDRANINPFPDPLRDRFAILELEPPKKDEWLSWARNEELDPRVIGFIEDAKAGLNAELNSDNDSSSGDKLVTSFNSYDPDSRNVIFSTPRSWEKVSKSVDGVEDVDTIELLTAQHVGKTVANQFVDYIELYQQVQVEDFMKNPEEEGSRLNEMKYHESYAVVRGLAQEIFESPERLASKFTESGHPEELASILLRIIFQFEDNERVIDGISRTREVASRKDMTDYTSTVDPNQEVKSGADILMMGIGVLNGVYPEIPEPSQSYTDKKELIKNNVTVVEEA